MKNKVGMVMCWGFVCTAGVLCAGPLDTAWIRGSTDKDPLSYKVGEEIVITLTPQAVGEGLVAGEYSLAWRRTGDDGIKENGRVPFESLPFVYRTKMAKPGFVRVYAEVVDKAGKTYKKAFQGDTTTPEGREAANRFERQPKQVFFDGGAAAEPEKMVPRAEPADFDVFWARQRERLTRIPMRVRRELVKNARVANVYAVEVDCAGLRPVTGYLTVPHAAETGAKFPCRLVTHGYGYQGRAHNPPQDGNGSNVTLEINAHGMKLPAFGCDEAYLKAFGFQIRSNGQGYAFDPAENKDPETAYFNGMVLRVMRALQYLKSLPEWNGKDLIAAGGSQGGLQTIWAAGCGEGVTRAESTITWCCDLGGELEGRNRGPWYIHWSDGLGYYDAVNFAKRIPKSCETIVPRAGLGDYTCPPSGLALMWNVMTCPKEFHWVQGSTHGYVPPQYEGRDFVKKAK